MAKSKVEPSIHTIARVADQEAILHVLQDGERQIEREIKRLNIAAFLEQHPGDRDALAARARLGEGNDSPLTSQTKPAAADSAVIEQALRLITSGERDAMGSAERPARLRKLAADLELIVRARFQQEETVRAIRAEESDKADRPREQRRRERGVKLLRLLQQVAAVVDEQRDEDRAFAEAGYTLFLDRSPLPAVRVTLLLGSERDWDSEISRARRRLEELKVI
jgi:hypothetical protein